MTQTDNRPHDSFHMSNTFEANFVGVLLEAGSSHIRQTNKDQICEYFSRPTIPDRQTWCHIKENLGNIRSISGLADVQERR